MKLLLKRALIWFVSARRYSGDENSEFRKKVVQKEYKVVSQLKKYANKIIEV